jgi:phage tail sheath gpL-like
MGSADDVAVALGEGSLGHLAAIQMYAAFGNLQLDVVAPAPPTGAPASITLVIAGTPSDENQFTVTVAGRESPIVSWAFGESIGTFRTRLIGVINAIRTDRGRALLPVTASDGSGGGDVDVDANGDGYWGNDITISVTKIKGTGGTLTSPAANLSGGTGDFDIGNALASVATTEYAAIGLATSNTDASDDDATSNPGLLAAYIAEKAEGLDALLQYGYVGHTGSIANVELGAIGRNFTNMTYAFIRDGQSLPSEVMGWDLGDSMRWYAQRASYNRIGNSAPYLIGGADKTTDKLSGPEVEDLLSNGVTPYDFPQTGETLYCIAPITTHSQDDNANNDVRCYWQLEPWVFNAIGRDLRTAVPAEFPNASITEDLPPGADALPPGVVERRDVFSFVVGRTRAYVPIGWIQSNYLEEVVASGELQVEIDQTDPSQVNIFIPARAVKPLAKFSNVVHKTG